MQITVRTIGNRSLYRELAESYDSETKHRTLKGVMHRLKQILRDESAWIKASGKWGYVTIEVDGHALDGEHVDALFYDVELFNRDQIGFYDFQRSFQVATGATP